MMIKQVVALISVVYVLFQKKKLPRPLTRLAARFYFWPTIPITISRLRMVPPHEYWSDVDATLLVGGAPLPPPLASHVSRLSELGVTGVVNMCDEYGGPLAAYSDARIAQLRLPTVDHFEPSVRDLRRAVKFIDARSRRGERVLVHCKAGHGRSAAVALCWLLHRRPDASLSSLAADLGARRKVRKTLAEQPNVRAFAKRRRRKPRAVDDDGSPGTSDDDEAPDSSDSKQL